MQERIIGMSPVMFVRKPGMTDEDFIHMQAHRMYEGCSDVLALRAFDKLHEGASMNRFKMWTEDKTYDVKLLGLHCHLCGHKHTDTFEEGLLIVMDDRVVCLHTDGHYQEVCGETVGYVVETGGQHFVTEA